MARSLLFDQPCKRAIKPDRLPTTPPPPRIETGFSPRRMNSSKARRKSFLRPEEGFPPGFRRVHPPWREASLDSRRRRCSGKSVGFDCALAWLIKKQAACHRASMAQKFSRRPSLQRFSMQSREGDSRAPSPPAYHIVRRCAGPFLNIWNGWGIPGVRERAVGQGLAFGLEHRSGLGLSPEA